MDFSGMSQTLGSIRNNNNEGNNSGDLQSCIDVGQIMENIQREQFIRQQKSAEQTEGITTSLLNWKNTNDSEMKTLENQMELLRKRKEQIKQNSTEMSALANQLRQRLELIRGSKEQSELGREDST
ncbi:uncharacterized protein CELE_F28H1.5 [Caenorhabditis elegans]|uniref:Uncharacterized protein n=1 Tax=Caenorhabditis elegans TaxID=6239 RepID=O01540_CAEEL|nr:Uncharacterized protein CELE_F28H1.5 [Caenorhabditis elegans]CCD70215.2 Uncharacterized protein CELE_F28H1.5 [Caenorhabditis elegans]